MVLVEQDEGTELALVECDGGLMKRLVLFVGLFTLCFCLVSAKQEIREASQAAAGTCWISQVPNGSPVSVLSQSESGKESLAWLSYSGVVSNSVKFSMKY